MPPSAVLVTAVLNTWAAAAAAAAGDTAAAAAAAAAAAISPPTATAAAAFLALQHGRKCVYATGFGRADPCHTFHRFLCAHIVVQLQLYSDVRTL